MSIYTYSAAGKGNDQDGNPVAVSITLQHRADQERLEDGAATVAKVLRAVAEQQNIDPFTVIQCSGSKNTISPISIPADLRLTEG